MPESMFMCNIIGVSVPSRMLSLLSTFKITCDMSVIDGRHVQGLNRLVRVWNHLEVANLHVAIAKSITIEMYST